MTNKLLTGGALATLAAALAFTAVPASAQDWQHNRHDRNTQQDSRGNQQSGDRHQQRTAPAPAPARGNWNQGAPTRPTPTPQANTNANRSQWTQRSGGERQAQTAPNNPWRAWNGNRGTTVQQNRANTYQGRNPTYVDPNRNTTYRDNQRNWQNDRRNNNQAYRGNRGNYQQWNRNWRNNNQYDWQRYRTYNRNAYHLNPYYAPYRDYSYRRLGVGFYLDPLFFGQDYLIGDPGYYRLPDVYGPYRWVRYYDDAVLVDVYSGEVVDVIYDFFW